MLKFVDLENIYHLSLSFEIIATLVLNWNEDGMIYRKKSTAPEAIETCEKSGEIQVNKMVAPSHLNPYIRGLRLGFVLLFCFIDIGYALYLVLIYFIMYTNVRLLNSVI